MRAKRSSIAREQRSRELLPNAAQQLARMVLDTPGLTAEHYAHACTVLNLTTAKPGNRDHLTIEQKNEIYDLMAPTIAAGGKQEVAALIAMETLPYCANYTERHLIEVFKQIDALQMRPK
jgi:hypothetical protein